GGGPTLVLTARAAPYTVADLRRLAPRAVVAQGPGTYLLTESLYVAAGATLYLDQPGLTLRLASDVDGHVSIVSVGGRIVVVGGSGSPVTLTSWDRRAGAPDTRPDDGRAYLRAVAGALLLRYAAATHLGFGGGPTGGVSAAGPDPVPPPAPRIPEDSGGAPLVTPEARYTRPLPYEPVTVRASRFAGNAVGLSLDGAARTVVVASVLADNLGDGLVLRGAVTDARVSRTTARANGGSGFVLSAAAHRTALTWCTAEANGRDGFAVAAGAHPEAPAHRAVGADSEITSGTAQDNARHGISVTGARRLTLRGNRVVGGETGIVVRASADVAVVDNHLRSARRHGVAVLDGAGPATVENNVVAEVRTGVYVREAVAAVRGNTVTKAGAHGVTFVGRTTGSAAAGNVLGSAGGSPVRLATDGEVTVAGNRTVAEGAAWWPALASATPTTVLWGGVGALLLVMRLRRRRVVPPVGVGVPARPGGVRGDAGRR
ncbi:MAG TPA: right-handed parallel beta-helix repeat-containing protein, partial [Pilimelia sp.]|nr:right-handed parallel beta-helix repeat-containing protein [Pilimelia sp.]